MPQSRGAPAISTGPTTLPANVIAAAAGTGAQDAGAAPPSLTQSLGMVPLPGAAPETGAPAGGATTGGLAAGAAPDLGARRGAAGDGAAGR
jgi:hypothetical protein